MAESDQRRKVIKGLKTLDAVPVENPVMPGTPDVHYMDGWIELKWLRAWPARPGTIVRIEHYTPQQKLWIRRRHLAGGNVFLLLQVRKEWMLFTHPATMEVGKLTKQQLIDKAYKYWPNGLRMEELIKCLN